MNKPIKIAVLGLATAIVFIFGCYTALSPKLPSSISKIKFENIKSARIETEMPAEIYKFDFSNTEQTNALKKVISSLNSANVKGYENEKVANKGGSTAILILELQNGSVIQITPAFDDKIKKLSDGSAEISKCPVPNESSLRTNSSSKPLRILSPEINKLIDGGYKDIFK